MYHVVFTATAKIHAARLKRSEPTAYKKLLKLTEEIAEHPRMGTGHPKPLSNDKSGSWARHISSKHRMQYDIDDEAQQILILAAWGHYDDK
jgi:toxin YoeB